MPLTEIQIPANILLLRSGRNEVLSDRKMPAHLRVFIYKTSIRPALAYGNETWPVTGILIDKVGSCEMRMLSYRIRISSEEHRRDEEIKSGAYIMLTTDVIRAMKILGGCTR